LNSAVNLAGACVNVGAGPRFDLLDIGHPDYVAVVEADSAFWTLAPRDQAVAFLLGEDLAQAFADRKERFDQEMQALRFGLTPSAVYFNPTERCNLNCQYCYLPEDMRRSGVDMSEADLNQALEILAAYFQASMPEGSVPPQIIFHGSEPLLRKETIFPAIKKFGPRFRFGIQTNATLLDDAALEFIRNHEVSLGISLDAHLAEINDKTRRTWGEKSIFGQVSGVLEKLAGYANYSVICTVTQANVEHLTDIVDFFHQHEVGVAMLNPVRCTQIGGQLAKPADQVLARHFIDALDRAWELYQQTGRRLVIANFANILIGIAAPTARRLMCDISPCGGGRCFFAVAATGDLYPCSEFIGLPEFRGGNLFDNNVPEVLASPPFRRITGRKVEDFEPCGSCAIRHFCGSPCPAEVFTTSGTMQAPAPYCEFYIEQAKYAFRILADERLDGFLWEGWNKGTEKIFAL
jgi:uncharacterized protein